MNNIIGLENINESLSTHYLIYKIVNSVNQKYYIGQHVTNNPYDDYMGSGLYLKQAQIKYGLSVFIKEILFDYSNFDQMNNKEIELVQLSNCFPYDQMSYNLREGGNKQFSIESKNKLSKSLKEGGKLKGKNNPMYGKNWKDYSTEEKIKLHNKHVSESHKGHSSVSHMSNETYEQWKANISKTLTGRHLSKETKQKIGLKSKGRNPYANKTIEEKHKSHMKGVATIKNKPLVEQQQIIQKYKDSMANRTEQEKLQTHLKHIMSVSGEKNPAFGRKWMYNPNTKEKVYSKKEDVQNYLALGFVFGTGKNKVYI